jgi:hydrogenase expression/formation protein HypC
MCLGVPGQIVQLDDALTDLATVDVGGVRRRINIGLISPDGIAPGDWVLIHVGFAMSKVDEEDAQATLGFLEGLGQTYEEELVALNESRIE